SSRAESKVPITGSRSDAHHDCHRLHPVNHSQLPCVWVPYEARKQMAKTGAVQRKSMVAAALGVALLIFGCVLPGMGSPASEVAVQDPAGNLIRLAHAAQQEGRLETALGLYQQAHAVEPHAMVPLLASGEILQSLGRYDEAAALYRQARSQDPTNPDPYRELGKAFIAQDTASEALKEFDAALHRDSRDFRS